ncbi:MULTISPECIES: GntR family transcriptional regulator [Marinobacter]|jgi:DNA-binding GntR family transcriptional regulator|uniref:Transcriptional regulator, GntR family n=1 Tax=Marinobacter nauticus TaxID=2743 RepID=A0A833JPS1_MARNT|nr:MULTISPECIES: GntR family transcriptional regulator [Marinobacter]ERS84235.1 GntR family transcriptional regulator [Marinobacter sp. C1S70]KAE8545742.1 Transcriptional regulator, GntR family [Marinobacter nauticus]MBY6192512.1 GntR family transcriptional regulator [Marinobacter nauticus]MBY6213660.1 GntR family transcriptional regulator [Marinobacter nauticus]
MDFQVPNTLAEQIANYLAERIMTGQVPPGERIQEATLASELKVSRASVKEALYTLERWHLVEITPRKGASATQLNAEYAAELYDVYMHLLMMLASRLCERWKESDRDRVLAAVSQVVERIQEPQPDITRVVEASFNVMEACCEVVANPYLTEALSNFKPAVSRAYYLGADRYRQGLATTSTFFSELPQAVLARDAPKATELIRGFAEHQKNLIRQALD